MAPPRIQGWDPILIISQIVCLQSLHYLTLSILLPPLLTLFAEPHALAHQGGSANVNMIMDWRELCGRPTISGILGDDLRGVWSGGRKLGGGTSRWEGGWEGGGGTDALRGWVLAVGWVAASGADIFYVYHLIRKPTHVLDFVCTLLLNHLILTTYYSASVPTSPFFWIVTLGAGAMTVIFAEQLCVRREMREGLGLDAVTVPTQNDDAEEGRLMVVGQENIEMGAVAGGSR